MLAAETRDQPPGNPVTQRRARQSHECVYRAGSLPYHNRFIGGIVSRAHKHGMYPYLRTRSGEQASFALFALCKQKREKL
jgi:hypothetical protein